MMETQSKFLESIERRRLLADILKIPPILLGLGSLAELEELLSGKSGVPVASPFAKRATVTTEMANLYKDAFQVYSNSHSAGSISESTRDIETWVTRMEADIPGSGKLQSELNQTLWGFHYLLAKVYGSDLEQYKPSFSHVNAAMTIANVLSNSDLKASTMYLSAEIHFAEQSIALARSDMIAAVDFAKGASSGVKAGVYTIAALAFALTQADLSDTIYTEKLLEQAGNHAHSRMDVPFLRMDYGKFLLDSADVLISLGRYGKALEYLDSAEEYIDPSRPRRYAQTQILRAESAIKAKRPDYEYAVTLLLEALGIGKSVHSSYTIGYVRRLYKLLATTTFSSNPQLAQLRMSLKA
ncbi:MAG TPA: hypothetical protein VGD98_23115 [Ktedonobacteraceae bacterium]